MGLGRHGRQEGGETPYPSHWALGLPSVTKAPRRHLSCLAEAFAPQTRSLR